MEQKSISLEKMIHIECWTYNKQIPAVGVIESQKNRLFYSFGKENSFMIENNQTIKLNCKKKTPNKQIIALTNDTKPLEDILNKLKKFGMTSFKKLSCSYKYCVIATGEFDIYADKVRANEWDDAAGQAMRNMREQ